LRGEGHSLIAAEATTFMLSEIVEYLRERALMCVRLARACRELDLATSHALEGLAADLMAKAKELEELPQ
jgi:hypothetical protein